MALTKAHNRMIEGAPVNVKDYGAVGDGVTDDTAAIQAAIDSGASTVIIPSSASSFLIADVTLSAGISLVGEGGEISFVLGSTASGIDMQSNSSILNVNFDISGADSLGTSAIIDVEGNDCRIEGCLFDGKTSGPSAFKANYTIRISNTLSNLRTHIINNRFRNTYFGVIRQAGTTGDMSWSKINGNSFIGVDKGDAIEINVGADVDIQVRGNTIYDVSGDGVFNAGIAIGIAGDEGVGGAPSSEIRKLSIANNIVDNAVMGIHVEGCNSIIIANNMVNSVTGNGTEGGIQIYSSDDFLISGNQVGSCTIAGIQVQAEGTDQSSSGTVSGNLVKDCTSGINIDTDVASSSIVISGNHVKNSTSKGVGVKGSADYNISANGTENCVLGYSVDAESNANNVTVSANTSTNDTTTHLLSNTASTTLYSAGNSFLADFKPTITIVADDTTPAVASGNNYKTTANTVATAITDFTGSQDGQIIHVRGGSSTNASTIADSGNFRLVGAMTLNANASISLQYNDTTTIWYEISRSVT